MYGTSSNNGSNNGCTETSISGEDEEKRSQGYSSQTDYAMVSIIKNTTKNLSVSLN